MASLHRVNVTYPKNSESFTRVDLPIRYVDNDINNIVAYLKDINIGKFENFTLSNINNIEDLISALSTYFNEMKERLS